jgi:hypothetical protein
VSEPAFWRRLLPVAASLCLATVAVAEGDAGLADPTRPGGWRAEPGGPDAPGPLASLRLQGTFSVGGERSALVSGQRVTVGDRVGGAEVIGVDRDRVILRVDGETVELASAVPAVKSPTQGAGGHE